MYKATPKAFRVLAYVEMFLGLFNAVWFFIFGSASSVVMVLFCYFFYLYYMSIANRLEKKNENRN